MKEKLHPQNRTVHWVSYGLFVLSTLLIFIIAQAIKSWLTIYELNAFYVSFCAGFILFVPLVSLVLHPFAVRTVDDFDRSYFSTLLANIGLVMFVQLLFFLIWITDAVAVYSIYVDQSSFLAQAFNISSEQEGDFGHAFFVANIMLAWLFSLLSLVIGILPCLIARLNNAGIIGNFVSGFRFAKRHKYYMSLYAMGLSASVMLPLIYANYLFLISFPLTLFFVFKEIVITYKKFLNSD